MKIGELAQQLGIAASAIRYYEQQGLIEVPKRVSGQRVYDTSALLNLKLIQLAKAAGFTISEVKTLVQGYSEGMPLFDGWHELATKKRAEVDKKIEELKEMKMVIDELLICDCKTVETCVENALDSTHCSKPN